MRKWLLGGLLLGLAFSGVGRPAAAQLAASTVYLPVLMRDSIPGYVSPLGAILYFDVGPNSGITQMSAARAGWAVTRLFWSGVEPFAPVGGVHTYVWTSVDAQIEAIRSAGLKAIVTVTGNPTWAAQYQAGPLYDAAAREALVAFVAAAAARYPDVTVWNLYPEPDNTSTFYAAQGWGLWGNDAANYASLLAQLKPALAAANPAAQLLSGPLAYDHFVVFDQNFLPNLLSALNTQHGGAAHVLDGIAFHYYTSGFPTVTAKIAAIRAILAQYNASALPLWIPESGHASGGTAPGETSQAQQLVQTYVRAFAGGVKMLAWYNIFDVGTDTVGLFRGNDLNQPKPAYFTYQRLANELNGAAYAGPLAAAGAEGYVFALADGRTRTIVWGTQAGQATGVAFNQTCLSVRDLVTGATGTIPDGALNDGDGAADGMVVVGVGADAPLSISRCP